MFQKVCQKGHYRSIGTVFMCKKCMTVPHEWGIAF